MPANVYVMEAANLICGDTGNESAPGASTHLTLARLKLPNMAENYVDFLPGGAPVAFEVNTHVNRLEASFVLNGWQPEVMGLFGQPDPLLQRFTAYGLVRERATSTPCRAIAVMFGRLGQANPTEFRRGDLQTWEYSIRSITYYCLMMSAVTNTESDQYAQSDLNYIYEWDFFASTWRVRSPAGVLVDVNADMITALGLYNVPITQVF